jgi:gas vesicle protein
MRGFLIGAACGVGIALLYAPMTGRRTRALLRDKAVKAGHDTTDFIEGKKRHVTNKMEGYRHKAREMVRNITDSLPGTDRDSDLIMDRPMVGV